VASGAAQRLLRVLDALVPSRGEPGSPERLRTRAAAATLAAGVAVGTLSIPADLVARLWLTALLVSGLVVVLAGLLLRLRGGGDVARTHVSLSVALGLYLVATSTCEQSDDFAAVAWVVVMSLAGLLLVGVQAGLWGAVAGLGVAVLIVVLPQVGVRYLVQPHISVVMGLGRYVALLVVVVALTSTLELLREEAAREAARAARARSLFLANVSHELRTPMNGVLGLTELVLATDLQPAQREQLELAHRSGRLLVAVIDDMLDLTRVESGGLRLEALAVDVRAMVADVLAVHRPLATRRGLLLREVVGEEVPRACLLDPTRVRQVLTNLVGNALKFTPRGSVTLGVAVEGEPRLLAFSVRDTGIGIAAEGQARLFKPFSQVDDSHTRRFGGTGLGLALSQQLARAMQGSLTVESTPGQGSVFTLRLPCSESSLPVEPLAPLPAASSISGLRLAMTPPLGLPGPDAVTPRMALVVDDNPVNLRVARGLVERLGHPVDTACTGAEALEKARSTDYLFVLMDCHMPELDGFQATRAVRALGTPRAAVPIIALTASVLPEDVAACEAAGMDGCLAKPLSLQALQGVLGRVLHPRPPA
jgi:signal transduction histidine kinase/CheY-like chemotaxis protein